MTKRYILEHANHQIKLRFPILKIEKFCQYQAPSILIHDCHSTRVDFSRSPYWLFCPHLVQRIHQLESCGWIKILQDFIQGPLASQWAHFTKEVPLLLESKLAPEYFAHLKRENRANIGGVKDPFHLKCLHAHYSFYQVHGAGWVGQFVEGLLKWRASRAAFEPQLACQAKQLECDYHQENV